MAVDSKARALALQAGNTLAELQATDESLQNQIDSIEVGSGGSSSPFDNWPNLPYKRMGWAFPDFNVDCLAALPDGKYDMVSCVWYEIKDDGRYYYRVSPGEDGTIGLGTVENINFVKKYTKEQYINVACGGANCATKMLNLFANYQEQFIEDMLLYCINYDFIGIDIDFERYASWTNEVYAGFKNFIIALCTAFHAANKKVVVDIPSVWNDVWDGESPYEWHRRYTLDPVTGQDTTTPIVSSDYFKLKYEDFVDIMPVDYVVVMCYDYMWDMGSGAPNCPTQWLIDTVNYAKSKIPVEKIIIGLPADGYMGPDTTEPRVYDGLQHWPYYIIAGKIGFANAVRNPDSLELEWRDGVNYYNLSDTYTIDEKNRIVSEMGITNITYWHLGGNMAGTLNITSDKYPSPKKIRRMGWIFPDYSIDPSKDYNAAKLDTISCIWWDMDKTADGVVYFRNDSGEDGDGKYGMPFDSSIDFIKKSSNNQYVDVACALPNAMDALCSDATKITNFINTTLAFLQQYEFEGIDFDFEVFSSCTDDQYTRFVAFINQLTAAYHAAGKKVMITAPAIWNDSFDTQSPYEWRQRNSQSYYKFKYEDFTAVDYLVPMAYDYHLDVRQSGEPCSPTQWMLDVANWAKSKLPVEKIIMGIPAAGYYHDALFHPLRYKQAAAVDGFNTAVRDPSSGELQFTGTNGKFYDIPDDTTIDLKVQALQGIGITAYSLWHIGENKYGVTSLEPPGDVEDRFNDNAYSDALTTLDQTIVGAINEVNTAISNLTTLIGNANSLDTTAKTLVPAINEVLATGLSQLNARIPYPVVVKTQAEYDALVTAGTVDASTLYLIKEV